MTTDAPVPSGRPLEAVSTVEALEADLERRLLDGELAPGDHLREVELSEQYAVGRHTLRAALDRLVHRGLLEGRRNRGVFVRVLGARDLADVYELRVALEVQVFRTLAVRAEVPAGAREAIADLARLAPEAPQRLVVAADLAFHRAIVAAAGNRRLAQAYANLEAEIQLCLAQLVNRYATAAALAEEHTDLVRAIERGRPGPAEAAIRLHIERASAWLTRHAAPGPAPPD
jgi:DNA-binding GntR family transcriptional regulator